MNKDREFKIGFLEEVIPDVSVNKTLGVNHVEKNPTSMKSHLLVRVQRRKLQRPWERRSIKRKQLYDKFHSLQTLNYFQIIEEQSQVLNTIYVRAG